MSASPDGRPEARTIATLRRSVGSPLLFSIVYTPLASALYFSLGVISGHALGLTPLVFVLAAALFALTTMTYAEGASMYQERSGSTVFARYAFNELVSFVAGWAILLPLIVGLIDTQALGGLLIGVIVVGFFFAVLMTAGGGAWDNAKKFIETGQFGGKKSEAHKAAIVGDTVGDPFKDTAGPSLHVLIKLLATITLVLAPLFV